MIEIKGYLVIDTEIINSEAFAEYVEKSTAVITAQGGRFLVRTSDASSMVSLIAPFPRERGGPLFLSRRMTLECPSFR